MSLRSERLQPAADQAQKRQDAALQRLAESQQRLAFVQGQLEELQRYREEYSLSTGGVTVTALVNRQQFLDRIDKAIAQQLREIERQNRQLETVRLQWVQAHARERAIGSVIVRYQTLEQQSEDRREQAEVDERMQYRRNPSGSS